MYYLPPNNLLVFISCTAFHIISFPFELHTCTCTYTCNCTCIQYNYIMFVSHTCTCTCICVVNPLTSNSTYMYMLSRHIPVSALVHVYLGMYTCYCNSDFTIL